MTTKEQWREVANKLYRILTYQNFADMQDTANAYYALSQQDAADARLAAQATVPDISRMLKHAEASYALGAAFKKKPLPFGMDKLSEEQLSLYVYVTPDFDGWTLRGACCYLHLHTIPGMPPPELMTTELGPVPEGTPGRLPVGTITNPTVQIQPGMTLGEALTMLCTSFEGVCDG
jgi:hypothetical protein